MRQLRRLLTWIGASLAMLLLVSCGTQPIATGAYTVKRGDTLYAIAARHHVALEQLAKLNGIGKDYLIYPGQVLRLSSATPNPATVPLSRPATVAHVDIDWQRPTFGDLEKTIQANGGAGLVIRGQLGQAINAAAAGRVVYTGNGLLGYGQLIIIKHDEIYLSAYGHVQTVQVQEGNEVLKGQPIATMGNGPAGTPMLYFEIRANGQPIDPIPLLQK